MLIASMRPNLERTRWTSATVAAYATLPTNTRRRKLAAAVTATTTEAHFRLCPLSDVDELELVVVGVAVAEPAVEDELDALLLLLLGEVDASSPTTAQLPEVDDGRPELQDATAAAFI